MKPCVDREFNEEDVIIIKILINHQSLCQISNISHSLNPHPQFPFTPTALKSKMRMNSKYNQEKYLTLHAGVKPTEESQPQVLGKAKNKYR